MSEVTLMTHDFCVPQDPERIKCVHSIAQAGEGVPMLSKRLQLSMLCSPRYAFRTSGFARIASGAPDAMTRP